MDSKVPADFQPYYPTGGTHEADPNQNPPPYAQSVEQPGHYFPQNEPSYGYDQPGNVPLANATQFGGHYDPRCQSASGSGQTPQQVVVVQPGLQHGNVTLVQDDRPNMQPYMALSCFTAWCCCLILGIFAYMAASDGMHVQTAREAKQRAKLSLGLNIAGIIIGIAVLVAVGVVYGTQSNEYYYYNN